MRYRRSTSQNTRTWIGSGPADGPVTPDGHIPGGPERARAPGAGRRGCSAQEPARGPVSRLVPSDHPAEPQKSQCSTGPLPPTVTGPVGTREGGVTVSCGSCNKGPRTEWPEATETDSVSLEGRGEARGSRSRDRGVGRLAPSRGWGGAVLWPVPSSHGPSRHIHGGNLSRPATPWPGICSPLGSPTASASGACEDTGPTRIVHDDLPVSRSLITPTKTLRPRDVTRPQPLGVRPWGQELGVPRGLSFCQSQEQGLGHSPVSLPWSPGSWGGGGWRGAPGERRGGGGCGGRGE